MIPGSANPLLLKSAAAGGLQIQRSLRFNSSDSAYLSKVFAVAGNRRTWTWSGWVKRSALGSNAGNAEQYIFRGGTDGSSSQGAIIIGSDTLYYIDNYSTYPLYIQTTQVLRDPSAWYHILVAIDTTQATSSNRGKLYINGTQVTSLATAIYPSQNYDTFINSAASHTIGRRDSSFPRYFSGYLANIHFIDGQALTPSSFTETDATTGQLIPKTYTGSYGTNGFNLLFADNSSNTASTLGKDTSGLSNNWTPNNLSVTAGAGNDSLVDSPTNYGTDTGVGGEVRGNYATINSAANAGLVLSNGNLDFTGTGSTARSAIATIGMPSGKWYFEGTIVVASSGGNLGFGVQNQLFNAPSGTQPHNNAYGWVAITSGSSTTLYKANNGTFTTIGNYAAGDVIGIAVDVDAGKFWISRNGTWFNSGDPATGTNAAYTGLTGAIVPYVYGYNTSDSGVINFGQRPFAYTAPSGFKALCTQNLPAPLVTKSNTVMDVALWTGNGAARSITGLAFNPDLIWIKSRSAATNNKLTDSVRGVTKGLISNTTGAETTDTNGLTAFNSDGFSLGTDTVYNNNAATYVGWAWDAGTSTVSNTQGSITSQVRANATAGFSVVTYTGSGTTSTIGHGLGVAPSMIITKNRSSGSYNWGVYHAAAGNSVYGKLNLTDAFSSLPIWQNTTPSSTVFYVGNYNAANQGSDNYVAYCFAPVVGYSSFGSYTGNGSADGPFVFTGMRPRWILFKKSSGTENWRLHDTARSTYNAAQSLLFPNLSNAETTSSEYAVDILSNGFKIRTNGAGSLNDSGATYIYAAFAEAPLNYSRAR